MPTTSLTIDSTVFTIDQTVYETGDVIKIAGPNTFPIRGKTKRIAKDSTPTITVPIRDQDGEAIDVSALSIRVDIEQADGTLVANGASVTKNVNVVGFNVPAAASATVRLLRFQVINTADAAPLFQGVLDIRPT